MNTSIMDSYKTGRSAIVANEHTIKTSQVSELNTYFGQLAAASAIHYANEAKATTDQGDLLHALSECYAFTRALRYANPNQRELSPTEVETLLTNTFNDNLWLVKASDLNNLIDALSAAYGLVAWKDIL